MLQEVLSMAILKFHHLDIIKDIISSDFNPSLFQIDRQSQIGWEQTCFLHSYAVQSCIYVALEIEDPK